MDKTSTITKRVSGSFSKPDGPVVLGFADGRTGKRKASVFAEVADTPEKCSVGLSKHASLSKVGGMLFNTAGSFWMPPEMKFPLDIVFMTKSGEVADIKSMPMDNGRNRYSPSVKTACYSLEVPLGFCRAHGIKTGDRLVPGVLKCRRQY